MSIEGTRRVMETTSADTANQYLRFGWCLINQYVVEATSDEPRMVKFVLASVRRLEDTREVVIVSEPDEVNEYLRIGWKLIDKHVAASESSDRRDECIRFVLAWQTDDAPLRPGSMPAASQAIELSGPLDEDL